MLIMSLWNKNNYLSGTKNGEHHNDLYSANSNSISLVSSPLYDNEVT